MELSVTIERADMTQIDLSTITEPQGAKIMDKLKAHTDKPDTSRAAFEKWGHSQNQSGNTDRLQRKGDGYVFTTADIMWQAWQAARTDLKNEVQDLEIMFRQLETAHDNSGYIDTNSFVRMDSNLDNVKAAITAIKQQLEGE